MKQIHRLALFFVAAVLILNLCLTLPVRASGFSNSSLAGLANLRSLAKESLTYEEAIASNKPTLVEFYADWCTTCQSMSATVSHLKQQYGDAVNLVAIDIDNPEFDSLVLDYGVTGVPQFTFLDSKHRVVENLIGKIPEKFMAQIFEKLS